jgi:hypothetical protein
MTFHILDAGDGRRESPDEDGRSGMGLPACQQRVLDQMDGTLRASEPHMAAMFTIFARLSAGEPVGRESLADQRRRWWLRPGAALSALVLVPVMFAVIITGVLLGGPRHAGTSCAVGMPAAGTVPRENQSSCGTAGRPGQRSASAEAAASCTGPDETATTAHFAVWVHAAEAAWPSGTVPSGLC